MCLVSIGFSWYICISRFMEFIFSNIIFNFWCIENNEMVNKVNIFKLEIWFDIFVLIKDQQKKSLLYLFLLHFWLMLVHMFIKVSMLYNRMKYWIVLILDFSLTYSTVVCEQHDEYWEKRRFNKTTIINLTGEFLQGRLRKLISRKIELLFYFWSTMFTRFKFTLSFINTWNCMAWNIFI